MRNLLVLGAVVALLCFPVFAGGGDGGEKGADVPQQKAADDQPEQPIIVNIEEDPADHWGLVIKYVLPAVGVALVVGWFGKKQLGKKKAKKADKP